MGSIEVSQRSSGLRLIHNVLGAHLLYGRDRFRLRKGALASRFDIMLVHHAAQILHRLQAQRIDVSLLRDSDEVLTDIE